MIAAMPCECDMESVMSEAQTRTTELIRDNPAMSMFIVFSVGVAIGAVLGEVIATSNQTRNESAYERFGRQICDAMGFRA